MMIRLQKFLAGAGVASRRKAEELIRAGEIFVNGKKITELGAKVDIKNDIVTYGDKKVNYTIKHIYIMLHKPEGYVTTVKDQFDRPAVLDLIEDEIENEIENEIKGKVRLVPVGRLDYDSSGLLILTNDGELVYRLTHPKHEVEKIYVAKVRGETKEPDLDRLRRGTVIDGYKTAPAKVTIMKKSDKSTKMKISIHEGKNRQIRKMFESIGHEVVYLKRISIGRLSIGELKKGEYRYLKKDEIKYLKTL